MLAQRDELCDGEAIEQAPSGLEDMVVHEFLRAVRIAGDDGVGNSGVIAQHLLGSVREGNRGVTKTRNGIA